MTRMGDIINAVATTVTGVGWGLYALTGAVVIGVTLVIERWTRKG